MRTLFRLFAIAVALAGGTSIAHAHFNILFPDVASTKREGTVKFVYQWGHPFEHQLFDAPLPVSLIAMFPDSKKLDISKSLEKATAKSEGKDVTVYRFSFVPEGRGDHVFVLKTPPIWMEEEKFFFEDSVRVGLHVLTQKGWDQSLGTGFELVPLTRPYGLQAGMVFQAQALVDGKPVARSLVEIERYNSAPPKMLPDDEHITRQAKTDPNGVLTCTLTEPGWWCVTVQRDGGTREHMGKAYPVRQRSTLWVFVDEAPSSKGTK